MLRFVVEREFRWLWKIFVLRNWRGGWSSRVAVNVKVMISNRRACADFVMM